MKKITLSIVIALLFSLSLSKAAESAALIADSYPRKINIDHNFKGINILLYGARNEYGNIVVVVRGPQKDFVLRQKGKVAGIWTNTKNIELDDFYSFYYVASTMPIEEIENDSLLKDLKIGADNLEINDFEKIGLDEGGSGEYKDATIKLMVDSGLFKIEGNELKFWGETLFKTFIEFPKNIIKGTYSIDLYLFNDGLLHSFQSMPIIVEKVGFEAFIYDLAHEKSLIYGLVCVLIAITLGWMTGVFFGKR